MTITIPTAELVDTLAEALAFTPLDKDNYWHGVLIEWDGEALHVSAYDVLSGARISWIPGTGAEERADEEVDVPSFGGDDAPWRVFLSVPSVKEVVKTYKLAAKFAQVPLLLKVTPTGSALIVERSRDTGQSQHMGMWPSDPDRADKIPDVGGIAGLSDGPGVPLVGTTLSAFRLAAFAAAARHGVLVLTHGDPISLTAGDTFAGFLYPNGVNSAAASVRNSAAADLLRSGSGLHVADHGA